MAKNIIYILLMMLSFNTKAQIRSYNKTGKASFYADKFEGQPTANGEIYYHVKKTAAHRTLPFGTIVKVTNLENNRFVVVRINDRGPFAENRIIDLSQSAAKELDFIEKGLAEVRVKVIASTNDLPDKKITKPQTISNTYFKIDAKTAKPKGATLT